MDPLESRRRPWWIAFFAFALVVFAVLIFRLALSLAVLASGSDRLMSSLFTPPGLAAQVAFMAAALIGISVVLMRRLGGPFAELFGPGPCRMGAVAFALLGVVGVGLLGDEVIFLLHTLSPGAFDASGLTHFNEIFEEATPLWFAIITAAVMLGPGFGEELFFRGFVLCFLLNGMRPWAAVALSSAMFGFIHLDPLQSLGAFLIGLYLGYVVLVSKSLWPAILAHALNNLICALVARFGGDDMSRVWSTGHPWWVLLLAALLTGASILALTATSKSRPDV